MPTVPSTPAPASPSGERIDPIYLAMAAAGMHEQGRLFEQETKLAGDVVPSGYTERLREIIKSSAPTQPVLGKPPATIILLPKATK